MFEAIDTPWLVPFDGNFQIAGAPTSAPDRPDKKACKQRLSELVDELTELQRRLYASDKHSVLLVFQAMDAAGKDSTIRKVLSGVNPAGFQVYSFKQPSAEELDHDFLWRSAKRLPQRGRIGVFNRSYYEETLVVRVHPEYLEHQKLPQDVDLEGIWQERFESIRDHEKHLARNGTVVLKFWLNVSADEQKRRFISRIDEAHKNWKFSAGDLKERALWPQYMHAYEETLKATSKSWAPWYAIPADDKAFMRVAVAETVVKTLRSLNLEYPKVDQAQRDELLHHRKQLEDSTEP